MMCPICGLASADDFHVAGHTLSNWRMRKGAMPTAPGGFWRPIPTTQELAMLAGFAIENDMMTLVNRRWVKII